MKIIDIWINDSRTSALVILSMPDGQYMALLGRIDCAGLDMIGVPFPTQRGAEAWGMKKYFAQKEG